MSLWYLAGPMTGRPRFNYPAFEEATRQLRAKGMNILSPHEINAGLHGLSLPEGPEHRAYYLRNDIQVLLVCSGIILMPGWEASKGVALELHIAKELCMDVVFLEQML